MSRFEKGYRSAVFAVYKNVNMSRARALFTTRKNNSYTGIKNSTLHSDILENEDNIMRDKSDLTFLNTKLL